MKNYIQPGDGIDYVPTGDITGSSLVVKGALVGVVVADTAAGKLGVLSTEGVFALAKNAIAFAVGDVAYAAAGENAKVSKTDTQTRVGVVVKAALAGDAAVHVKLGA